MRYNTGEYNFTGENSCDSIIVKDDMKKNVTCIYDFVMEHLDLNIVLFCLCRLQDIHALGKPYFTKFLFCLG